ncbi:MAG: hypothetical protein WA432_05235 [Candidatus Babeliaceae bacterium]
MKFMIALSLISLSSCMCQLVPTDLATQINTINSALDLNLNRIQVLQKFFTDNQKQLLVQSVINTYNQTIAPQLTEIKQALTKLDTDIAQLQKGWNEWNQEKQVQNISLYPQLVLLKGKRAAINAVLQGIDDLSKVWNTVENMKKIAKSA